MLSPPISLLGVSTVQYTNVQCNNYDVSRKVLKCVTNQLPAGRVVHQLGAGRLIVVKVANLLDNQFPFGATVQKNIKSSNMYAIGSISC